MDFQIIKKDHPFKPEQAFRSKLLLYIIIVFSSFTTILIISFVFINLINSIITDRNEVNSFFDFIFLESSDEIILLFFFFNLCWIIPGVVLVCYYVRTIHYVVTDNEIMVHKGIINKTVTHIPYRTITNITTRRGILDRALGLGNIEIQTAGGSKTNYPKPKAKIEGIGNFNDVQEGILYNLRKLKSQYTTTTEIMSVNNSLSNDIEFYHELLEILNEIKEIVMYLSNV